MKTLIFTSIFVLFLVFLFPALSSFGIRYVEKESQPPFGKSVKVYGDYQLKQTFTAYKDNLTGLGISIRNINLQNKKDITLKVYLGDREVAESIVNGKVIPDGGLVKFIFTPIKSSKNVNLTFSLSAPSASGEESLEIFMTPDEKISFIEYYKPPSKLSLVKDIYKDWTTRFFKDRVFSVIYLLTLVSGAVYIFAAKN